MAIPAVDNLTVSQRDTLQTFLVDIGFDVVDADGDNLALTIEWAHDAAGPWLPATAQTFDRRHSATSPITGVPVAAPGKAVNYAWQAFFDLTDGTHQDVHIRVTIDDGVTQPEFVVGPFTIVAEEEPSTEDAALLNLLQRRAIVSRTPKGFMGNGLLAPFRRSSRDFRSGVGVDLIRSSVRQCLNTRAAVGEFVGELPWRPDFGSKLWILRHRQNNPTLRAQAFTFAAEALGWEPRVQVTEVFVERTDIDEGNLLIIRVRYRLIDENVDENDVLFPDFEEAVEIAA